MRIGITGAAGLLGAHLATGLAEGHTVVGLDRNAPWSDGFEMLRGDLEDQGFLNEAIRAIRPEIMVHCAAMLNVDDCEDDPARAYEINEGVTRRIARSIPERCLLVYVTTDGIFSGDEQYSSETDLPCPRTVYGRSKLHGEWEVQLATRNHLIVRTNFFGWSSGRKATAGEWLFHALAGGRDITLFDDFYFTPIYVVDLVRYVRRLISGSFRGIVNVVGRDRVSKHEFGKILAEVGGFSFDRVLRGSIEAAALKAPRPRDMSLSSERCFELTGWAAPTCRSGIVRFVEDKERPVSERVFKSGSVERE